MSLNSIESLYEKMHSIPTNEFYNLDGDFFIQFYYLPKDEMPDCVQDLTNMYGFGIHNYREEFNYPDSWLEESEIIDKWIMDNEEAIWEFQRNLLLNNKQTICELFEK